MSRAEREEQILEAASSAFGTRGYPSVNVVDIAARAGISKPLIYGYFGSKDGLYAATCRRAGFRLVSEIGQAMENWGDEPVDRGTAILEAIFTALSEQPHAWNLVFNDSLPVGSESFAAAAEYRRSLIEQAARGIQSSYAQELSDPDDLSALIAVWTAIVSAFVDWWLRNPEVPADAMAARVQRILSALQAAPPSVRPS